MSCSFLPFSQEITKVRNRLDKTKPSVAKLANKNRREICDNSLWAVWWSSHRGARSDCDIPLAGGLNCGIVSPLSAYSSSSTPRPFSHGPKEPHLAAWLFFNYGKT